MKKKILAIMMIAFIIALFACGGGGGSDDYTPSVYVAGTVSTGTGSNACYWKDGVRVDLPGDMGIAYGIAVVNGKVYVAGYYESTKACMWVDGVRQDLLNGSEAKGIKVIGNTVYIAGRSSDSKACVWINGVMSEVTNNESAANAIFVSNDTIYVAGAILEEGSSTAAIWSKPISGGTWNLKILQQTYYSEAFSVIQNNGLIYVTGNQENASNISYYPFIWTGDSLANLSETPLSIPNAYTDGPWAYPYSIIFYNGQSYVAGFYRVEISGNSNYRAALWIGNDNPILYAPEDGSDSAAFSVFVHNDDVYVAGNIEKDDSGYTYVQPCYWKNGVLVELSTPGNAGNDANEISSVGAHAIIIQ